MAYAAAHVVADPLAGGDPTGPAQLDWETTLHFRRHLWSHGLRVAEAMDTAQRGMGLDWEATKELIRRSAAEAKAVGGKLACGAGTDQLTAPGDARRRPPRLRRAARVRRGRGLAGDPDGQPRAGRRGARAPTTTRRSTASCSSRRGPGDPALARRHVRPGARRILGNERSRGRRRTPCSRSSRPTPTRSTASRSRCWRPSYEVALRERLPEGVRMYTGDDFNYPELIASGSDALLGIFDAIAPAAAAALHALDDGDTAPLRRAARADRPAVSRHIFKAPTPYYKTGVVFLAYLNGHQQHFRMVGGLESGRNVAAPRRAVRARRPGRPAAPTPSSRARACGRCSRWRASSDEPPQLQLDDGRPLAAGGGHRRLRGARHRVDRAVAAQAGRARRRGGAAPDRRRRPEGLEPLPRRLLRRRERRRGQPARGRGGRGARHRRARARLRPAGDEGPRSRRARRSSAASSSCSRTPTSTASGSASSRCTR